MHPELTIALFLSAIVISIAFWITQLIDLMSYPDDRFPGKHDKVCWLVVLIALNLLGAVAFWLFKTHQKKPDA